MRIASVRKARCIATLGNRVLASTDALREDLAEEDPRVKGYDSYRERAASADEAVAIALEAAQ